MSTHAKLGRFLGSAVGALGSKDRILAAKISYKSSAGQQVVPGSGTMPGLTFVLYSFINASVCLHAHPNSSNIFSCPCLSERRNLATRCCTSFGESLSSNTDCGNLDACTRFAAASRFSRSCNRCWSSRRRARYVWRNSVNSSISEEPVTRLCW